MNRRTFLKSLAGLPLLGFLKPEEVGEPFYVDANNIVHNERIPVSGIKVSDWVEPNSFEGLAVWDGGTWVKLDPNGSLTIKGDFLGGGLI